MRIAYTTTFNAHDVHHWSGTPFHMADAFTHEDVSVEYIGSLSHRLPTFFKLKQIWKKYAMGQRESPRFNEVAARYYSKQVAIRLQQLQVDAIVSPLVNPIAYLDCKEPLILWTDAVYSSLLGFYPAFAYHSARTIQEANALTFSCLSRVTLAIFSSDWAARSACELYGIARDKVKVVPYGANVRSSPSADEVLTMIQQRSTNKIQLLFLAKSWERKGGDIALNVAKILYEAGIPVELTIVGYTPKINPLPPYVNCLGFISKQTPEGKMRFNQLLAQSHFLILPSRADACPMVFAEANAYGLPCLTTHVGGIATAVRDNVNGMTFALDAPVENYVNYILDVMHNTKRYEELARSAQNEYVTRLNWRTAVTKVKALIRTVI